MLPMLAIGGVLVGLTAVIDGAAKRIGLPASIMLVIVGTLLSFVPAMPRVAVNPDLLLLLFLPPLLYAAGVGMSWRGFRSNLRPILLLAIGCVLFTASAVAGAAHWLVGLPWAVAFVLGAVVSPPDPVAPMAIARRLGLPSRLMTVLEGEGLVNDATALILFNFALAAVAVGAVDLAAAAGKFLVIIAGELVWGIGIGWATLRLRAWAKDAQVEIALSLLTPYLAFWIPHALGGSGVLAAVAAGLYVSWNGPRFIAPATRLQGYFVWGSVVHLFEGLVFLLTGLQAQTIANGLNSHAAGSHGWARSVAAAVLISAVVIMVRFMWVFAATYLPRWLFASIRRHDPYPAWQEPVFIGFTGIRGVVSLAAALSIPYTMGDASFPYRNLILFVTFVVIVVTLVGQGSLLPWVIGRLGLANAGTAEAAEARTREVQARIAGVDAALVALDGLATGGAAPAAVAALRRRHGDRRKEYAGTADSRIVGSPVADDARLQALLVTAERRKIAELYAAGAITDDARRRIERELDLEDARNRHALESATGDQLADPEVEAGGA